MADVHGVLPEAVCQTTCCDVRPDAFSECTRVGRRRWEILEWLSWMGHCATAVPFSVRIVLTVRMMDHASPRHPRRTILVRRLI